LSHGFKRQLLPIGLGFLVAYFLTYVVLDWRNVTCAITAGRYGFCDEWSWLGPPYYKLIDLGLGRDRALDVLRGTIGIVIGWLVYSACMFIRALRDWLGSRHVRRAHSTD